MVGGQRHVGCITMATPLMTEAVGPHTKRGRIATVVLLALATALMIFVLARLHHIGSAINHAPLRILIVATALQLISNLVRAEAWWQCVRQAGGTVSRRVLYRVSSIGFLGNVVSGGVGAAARIATLRRVAGDDVPHVPALLAAELPVASLDVLAGAICSFTLIGPLSLPWWVPVCTVTVVLGALMWLKVFAATHQKGFWRGLAVLRDHDGRWRLAGLVVASFTCQIMRNWLMLHAVGLDHISVLTAAAVMIGTGFIGQLPIGPAAGVSAVVLLLGSHGAGAEAGAGMLLTITGIAAALSFIAWALVDTLWRRSCIKRRLRMQTYRGADALLAAGFGSVLVLAAVGIL